MVAPTVEADHPAPCETRRVAKPSEAAPPRRSRPSAVVVVIVALAVVGAVRLYLRRAAPTRPRAAPLTWVVGDMHLHTEAKPSTSLQPAEVREAMRQNGLDVGALLVWGVEPLRTAAHFEGRGKDLYADVPIIHVDLETSSFSGNKGGAYIDHMIALGLRKLDFPGRLYTYPVYQWALDQGAVVGAAHACHWTPDLKTMPNRNTQDPSELPLCLALGQRLFLATEIVDSPAFRTLWYSLLSCGFEVPLAGGSDWPVAGTVPGECRTWVGLEVATTYDAWIEGIRRGRTVVSAAQGGRIVPTLDGETCGGVVHLAEPGTRTLELQVDVPGPERVEVVVNGEVAHAEDVEAGRRTLEVELTIDDSAWIAVRTPRLHTSALYVRVAGRPIRASVEAAEYFALYVDALLQQLRQPNWVFSVEGSAFSDPARLEHERTEAIEVYGRARQVFDQIREQAKARAR
jgi:hypothetical protein